LEKSLEVTWYMVKATRRTAADSESKRSAQIVLHFAMLGGAEEFIL
jgi:hypothetical protein